MREIDKQAIRSNIEEMINALEYDSMRSMGKAKINAAALVDLYALKAVYDKGAKAQDDTSTRKKAKAVAAD